MFITIHITRPRLSHMGDRFYRKVMCCKFFGSFLKEGKPSPPTPFPPLHLGTPQDVLLLIHKDREMLVLALLDGVGTCGDGSYFAELHREDKIDKQKVIISRYSYHA